MNKKFKIEEALTFDDVLLVPAKSSVLPREVDVTTYLTPEIKLKHSYHLRSNGYSD